MPQLRPKVNGGSSWGGLWLWALMTLTLLGGSAMPTLAGEADVLRVEAAQDGDGTWHFRVTVEHGDTGWDHYADRWDVVGPDGEVHGERILLHPHVDEQPFTRSLSGVVIPEGVTVVTFRAHDSVHGHGGKELLIDLQE